MKDVLEAIALGEGNLTEYHRVLRPSGRAYVTFFFFDAEAERLLSGLKLRRDEHGAVLEVTDRGPGVVRGEIESLGRRFFRASGASGPGSGLGLSIVQRIAEHFGGTVLYRRGPDDRGLVVALRFPQVPAA